MKELVQKDVVKLLDASIIYPISDSQWVYPVQIASKKSGILVIKNNKGELIPIDRPQGGWHALITES